MAPRAWTEDEAQALLDLVACVSRHRDRARLLDGLEGPMARMFTFDYLAIGVDDEATWTVQPFYMWPPESFDREPLARDLTPLRALYERGEMIRVSSRAEVAHSPPVHAAMEKRSAQSFCMLPLVSSGRGLGALSLGSRTIGTYDDVDVALAREAASIIAVALDNCLAYEALARARDGIEHENRALREALDEVYGAEQIVARSAPMREVMRLVELVAPTDATVLITGESGTGKELIARAVHARSARARRPLVALNCAAIPAGLVESELFGHEAGAFTGADRRRRGRFELAHQSTLFLDEIGELSRDAQAKVLRILQDQVLERLGGGAPMQLDVRIIAATHQDLLAMTKTGRFRADLYYRLAVFPIHLAPLRERREDIAALVRTQLAVAARRHGRAVPSRDPDMMRAFTEYDWPGNVRELVNAVERLMILSRGGAVDVGDLIGVSR